MMMVSPARTTLGSECVIRRSETSIAAESMPRRSWRKDEVAASKAASLASCCARSRSDPIGASGPTIQLHAFHGWQSRWSAINCGNSRARDRLRLGNSGWQRGHEAQGASNVGRLEPRLALLVQDDKAACAWLRGDFPELSTPCTRWGYANPFHAIIASPHGGRVATLCGDREPPRHDGHILRAKSARSGGKRALVGHGAAPDSGIAGDAIPA